VKVGLNPLVLADGQWQLTNRFQYHLFRADDEVIDLRGPEVPDATGRHVLEQKQEVSSFGIELRGVTARHGDTRLVPEVAVEVDFSSVGAQRSLHCPDLLVRRRQLEDQRARGIASLSLKRQGQS